jgi:Rrf2 family protein
MNLSRTTEYALQVMSLMAQDTTRLYRVDDIYNQLKIPYRYLRKLMTSLVRNEMIVSEQGKLGGYRIIKPLDTISLMDILNVCGDNFITNNCFFGLGDCSQQQHCMMHEKWVLIRESTMQVLTNTNLEDIRKNGPLIFGSPK